LWIGNVRGQAKETEDEKALSLVHADDTNRRRRCTAMQEEKHTVHNSGGLSVVDHAATVTRTLRAIA
jgi:hypothetical protein